MIPRATEAYRPFSDRDRGVRAGRHCRDPDAGPPSHSTSAAACSSVQSCAWMRCTRSKFVLPARPIGEPATMTTRSPTFTKPRSSRIWFAAVTMSSCRTYDGVMYTWAPQHSVSQ